MGRYVNQFEVTVTHDGEPITAVLRSADYGDVASLKGRDNDALIMEFQKLLANYIVELKGPTDAAGTQVAKETFLKAAYFAAPVIQIGSEWVKRAAPQNP